MRLISSLIIIFFTISNISFAMGSDDEKKLDNNYVIGKKAVEAGKYEEAIKALNEVILTNPDDSDAHNLLGYSYRQLKNYDKAFSYYKQALNINSDHKGALEYMGIAYIETGNIADAEILYSKLKDLCSFCNEKRSLDKAIKLYKRNN